MAESWIDKTFLSVFVHRAASGKETYRIVLFDREYWFGQPAITEVGERGFMLSLYQLLIARTMPADHTFEDEFKRIKTIPLLQKVVGSIVQHEIEWPEYAYDTNLGGVNYHIRKFIRYSAFKNFERWFSIKGSRSFVYTITSDTDAELPEYPFAHRTWVKRDPTPYEVLACAKELQRLTEAFGESLQHDMEMQNNNPPSDKE